MALFASEEAVARRRNLKGRRAGRDEPVDLAVRPNAGLPVVAEQAGSAATARGVGTGVIQGRNIKANSIVANHITANTINAGHITANSIKAVHIVATEVKAAVVKAGYIQADWIDAGQINVGHLEANTIEAALITADTVVANTVIANWIKAQIITVEGIDATWIKAGSVQTSIALTGGLVAGSIAAGTITTAQIDLTGTAQLRAWDALPSAGGKVRAVMDASGFRVFGPDGTTVWYSPENGVEFGGIADNSVHGAAIIENAITGVQLAANAVSAEHIVTTGLNAIKILSSEIYGCKIANSEIAPSYVLDSTGLGIAAIADLADPKALKFAGLGGVEVGSISYISGADVLYTTGGQIQFETYNGAISLSPASSVFIGHGKRIRLRSIGAAEGELVVEGAQSGLRAGVRWRAAVAAEWAGVGVQFRYRRVDGGGNDTAPSSMTVTATLQNTNITNFVLDSVTAYGCFLHVQATAAGDAIYDLAMKSSN